MSALALQEFLKGDVVSILREPKVPMLLRKVKSHFVIMGPCYVAGIVDGEVVDGREGDLTVFEIH
jgi:hypothetical protein